MLKRKVYYGSRYFKKRCFWDSHGLSPEALEESVKKADEESKNLKEWPED